MKKVFKKSLAVCVLVGVMCLPVISCFTDEEESEKPKDFNPTTIQLNTTYTKSMEAFGTHYYIFTTAGVGNYTISLTALTSDYTWDLALYNSSNMFADQQEIYFQDDYDGTDDDEVHTLYLNGSTTYALAVDEWDDIAGSYTLRVSN
jgi:hypothetical protein